MWNYRGSKFDLEHSLSTITGISYGVLTHAIPLSSVAVAQKMSWAAERETTRIEDTAYCLLGIFDVNMPLLYGEESKAFRRLQEEIIKSTADLSIFAWTLPPDTQPPDDRGFRIACSLLAASPASFINGGSAVVDSEPKRDDFSVSNMGIKTRVRLHQERLSGSSQYRDVLPLYCYSSSGCMFGVRLRKCGRGQWVRENPWQLVEIVQGTRGDYTDAYLLTKLPKVDLGDRQPVFPMASVFPPLAWQRLARLLVVEAGEDLPFLDVSRMLAAYRPQILQISLPPGCTLLSALPADRFDGEDFCFFLPDKSRSDACIITFRIHSAMAAPHEPPLESMEMAFIAVGWAGQSDMEWQSSLVPYRPNATALSAAETQLSKCDYDRQVFMSVMAASGVPKSPSAIFRIPDQDAHVEVYFKMALVADANYGPNLFWRVEVSYEIYAHKEPQKMETKPWYTYEELKREAWMKANVQRRVHE